MSLNFGEAATDTTKVHKLLRSSQKFSEVLRPLLRSSQNIYKMAASKKPNLANYPFGAASRHQKGGLDSFGFFEAAILYIFWELLRRGLRTSENF